MLIKIALQSIHFYKNVKGEVYQPIYTFFLQKNVSSKMMMCVIHPFHSSYIFTLGELALGKNVRRKKRLKVSSGSSPTISYFKSLILLRGKAGYD